MPVVVQAIDSPVCRPGNLLNYSGVQRGLDTEKHESLLSALGLSPDRAIRCSVGRRYWDELSPEPERDQDRLATLCARCSGLRPVVVRLRRLNG
jgi:hypothetical protein